MSVGALLLALHALGGMVWVGGTFFVLFVLRPGLAFLDGPARLAVHKHVLDRFFFVIWLVMPAMLVSGIAMQYLFYGGISSAPWPLNLMAVSGLAMSLVFVAVVLGPWKAFRKALAAENPAEAGAAVHQIRRLLVASLALAVLTTIVAMLDD